ncbi:MULTISPECIES: Type 1 glutamine amidotransferase-like domain-containing protein [unclassified Streptomyces]|uniref:Type 1 glutamine amidotransferase-like domain-containing protein n=1 Tax=unclassified Streptomyces TaxID=2593676 RepID=UPI002259682F|nr:MULTISPECIES: Type 1 glutamine amidotransferase-like domain-containing protein [unclassified Streptomyces]MCX5144871.1 Type 1 glutamine amidotransferase-like domain-containing protein [Streptomyces sp. NBC_00338]WRZ62871.1 Type 1 glutamine amidotransferase-like domain-containing protein [Streptomyces sp. NBC_01257]
MRMYLSSFRMGNHPDQLLALLDAPGPADIAVIANATDDQPPDRRAAGVRRETEALHSIGLRPAEIDLRAYFGRPREDVEAAFAPYPAVWVRGGNVFMLRHALARSGADAVLGARLRRDDLVYGGYSAGACVLAPSLRGLEQCDDPNAVTETYGDPVTWDGLGLLDHVVVPHIDSPGHPESEVLGRVAADYRAKGIAHRTLRDGQVLVAKDGRTRVC